MQLPLLLLLHLFAAAAAAADSPSCLAVYLSGGAPAVFASPSCPRWTHLAPDDPLRPPPPTCRFLATHQGRRRRQEDRAVCALDLRIPFLGRTGIKEVNVSIVAVFDGHNGAEASDLASKLLLEYYSVHVNFHLYELYSAMLSAALGKLTFIHESNGTSPAINVDDVQKWGGPDPERFKWTFLANLDDAFHMEILKESLIKTVHDIDVIFSKEASAKGLLSGSTATVVLIVDGQILTANLGDSKAFLCSEKVRTAYEQRDYLLKLKRARRDKSVASSDKDYGKLMLANSDGRTYYAKELTKDHHPDRDDERNRIEAAGGNVVEWAGVVRVNGQLAVSRSIGDIPFKNYGVISTPEVTDWHLLSSNDSYLVASSDGIFEKMTTQEVCDVLWDEKIRASMSSDLNSIHKHSLADIIIKVAFERGSMDNMSIVVLPLPLTGSFGTFMKDGSALEGSSIRSPFGLQQVIQETLGQAASGGSGSGRRRVYQS